MVCLGLCLFDHFLFGCRGRCFELDAFDLVLFGCTCGAGGNFFHDFHALATAILNWIVAVAEIAATASSLLTLATRVSLFADFNDHIVASGFWGSDLLAKVASKHIPVLVWFGEVVSLSSLRWTPSHRELVRSVAAGQRVLHHDSPGRHFAGGPWKRAVGSNVAIKIGGDGPD